MAVPYRFRVAVHEAAHALSARFQQVPVVAVEVDADGRSGRTYMDEARMAADPRVETFVSAAGPAAEMALCGPSGDESRGHRVDYARAEAAALRYGDGGFAMMGEVRGDAEAFVRRFAPLIRDMAAALEATGWMDTDAVEQFARHMPSAHGMPGGVPSGPRDVLGQPLGYDEDPHARHRADQLLHKWMRDSAARDRNRHGPAGYPPGMGMGHHYARRFSNGCPIL